MKHAGMRLGGGGGGGWDKDMGNLVQGRMLVGRTNLQRYMCGGCRAAHSCRRYGRGGRRQEGVGEGGWCEPVKAGGPVPAC